MGGEICFQVGKEKGPWFEIRCTKGIILSKEAMGEDATFERGLLRAWSKHTGWEGAKEALANCGKPPSHS